MKLHEFIPSFSYLRSYFLNYTNINRMTNWLNTLVRNTISSVGLSNFLWIYSRIKTISKKFIMGRLSFNDRQSSVLNYHGYGEPFNQCHYSIYT